VSIDGVIGFDLLRKFITKVDFDKAELTFIKTSQRLTQALVEFLLALKATYPLLI
jgi:hypothetical protein